MADEAKKKEKVPRQKMPEQEPKVRAKNFDEVPLGYSPETALLEAGRCLQCKKPACVEGCPVQIDIPAFIREIKEREFLRSHYETLGKNQPPGGLRPRLSPGSTSASSSVHPG